MFSFWHVGRILETRPFGRVLDQRILDKLEVYFKRLRRRNKEEEKKKSLLQQFFTKEIFDILKYRKTKNGATLYDVIISGVEIPDSDIGVNAPDGESYNVFGQIFDPIILEYHHGFKLTDYHPPLDFGDENTFHCLDVEGECIKSMCITCSRNLREFPFAPYMTEADFKEVEAKVVNALSNLSGDLQGSYSSLENMSEEVSNQLRERNLLFKEGANHNLQVNGCYKNWPTGRGIYHNNKMDFVVWVNEADHILVISTEKYGDLKFVYSQLVKAMMVIDQHLDFYRDDRLGYLTFCPSKLGTAMEASALIELPHLIDKTDLLHQMADEYELKISKVQHEDIGNGGNDDTEEDKERTEKGEQDGKESLLKIRNKKTLGVTENEMVEKLQTALLEMIRMEPLST